MSRMPIPVAHAGAAGAADFTPSEQPLVVAGDAPPVDDPLAALAAAAGPDAPPMPPLTELQMQELEREMMTGVAHDVIKATGAVGLCMFLMSPDGRVLTATLAAPGEPSKKMQTIKAGALQALGEGKAPAMPCRGCGGQGSITGMICVPCGGRGTVQG